MRRTYAICLCSAGIFVGSAAAQTDDTKSGSTQTINKQVQVQIQKADQPMTDATFVKKASAAGLAEVRLGEMAAEKSTSPDVKKFGQDMVRDHSKANKQLAQLADSKNIAPAQNLNKKHRAAAEKLSKLQGSDFDRAFMTQMLKDHKEAVALFETESKNGQDNDLKTFAKKTLPTLREHLKHARKLAGDAGINEPETKIKETKIEKVKPDDRP